MYVSNISNFESVILNVAFSGLSICLSIGSLESASLVDLSISTQFLNQVKINSTSQLINGIFKLLQKLLMVQQL